MRTTNEMPLPDKVFGRSHGSIVVIVNGEDGYRPLVDEDALINSTPRELNLEQRIDYLNSLIGVSKAQRQAMEFGSMFGWHLPLANPEFYDENGVIVIEKLKKL